MFGNILHRMILWELFKVFLISLVAITGILLLAGIVAEASQQGLGPAQILSAIPLLIPSTLPYTIPATTLFAACVVYGRLAADNEILAIKAAGINILQVVKPGLILGIATSLGTMGLYYSIIPYSHHLLRSMVFNDTEELLYSVLRRQNVIGHSSLPYSMWVRGVQGRKLLTPIFKHRTPGGQVDIVSVAREAELRVDKVRKILLVHMHWGVANTPDGVAAYFEDKEFEVPLPETNPNQQRPRDMTWQELIHARSRFLKAIEEIKVDISLEVARKVMSTAPQDLPEHIRNLEVRCKHYNELILSLDVEMLMRPALALGCFFFILVGSPVGIWFSKSDYLSSFITCFMPIIIVYYPLMLCGTGMAQKGHVNPVLMVWAADIVMALVGLVLYWRLMKN